MQLLKMLLPLCSFLALLPLFGASLVRQPNLLDKTLNRLDLDASVLLRKAGFLTKDYKVVCDDGFVLTVTRAINPKIKQRRANLQPILLVHGSFSSPNSFLANSFDLAKARDLSHLDASLINLDKLIKMLGKDPTSNSLPMLALNFGHEIFLVHRRGTPKSRLRVEVGREPPSVFELYKRTISLRNKSDQFEEQDNFSPCATVRGKSQRELLEEFKEANRGGVEADQPKKQSRGVFEDLKLSFNASLWDFSLDEQAAYDLPNVIDFVLKTSGSSKLVVVSESATCAVALMAFMLRPDLDHKVSRSVLWAPAFVLGGNDTVSQQTWLAPLLNYVGLFPTIGLSHVIQKSVQFLCAFAPYFCEFLQDRGAGPSNKTSPVKWSLASTRFLPVSAHEIVHLLQFAKKKRPHMFEFSNKAKNLRLYGRESSPAYDLSLIRTKSLTIWTSPNDRMTPISAVKELTEKLVVPVKVHVITDVVFNHASFNSDAKAGVDVIIPTYKDIADNTNHCEEIEEQAEDQGEWYDQPADR